MSGDKTPLDRAEEAVCEEIIRKAQGEDLDPDHVAEIEKLADAVAKLKWGPQGSRYAGGYETHEHKHYEPPERGGVGFG